MHRRAAANCETIEVNELVVSPALQQAWDALLQRRKRLHDELSSVNQAIKVLSRVMSARSPRRAGSSCETKEA